MVEKKDKTIGKYIIERKLGEGGFGVVYLSKDEMMDRHVAVKVLKGELASTPEHLERFRKEARLTASLNHPGIIRVIEVGEDEGRFYLAMDYLPNGTLAERLQEIKPLSIEETVRILKPVAAALDYAHKRGLVHRDIKPSNILFNEDGDPVISDFGLVKSLESTGFSSTTGMGAGTPEYMSPEQILGREATPATDVYALGVIAYQMLTGEPPFTGNTPFEIQKAHTEQAIPDPRDKQPALPEAITEIFQKALAKDTKERYGTAQLFLESIQISNQSADPAQSKRWVSEIRQAMDRLDYELAERLITAEMNLHPSNELLGLMQENNHRQEVLRDIENLKARQNEIVRKQKHIYDQEKWLDSTNEIIECADEERIPRRLSKQTSSFFTALKIINLVFLVVIIIMNSLFVGEFGLLLTPFFVAVVVCSFISKQKLKKINLWIRILFFIITLASSYFIEGWWLVRIISIPSIAFSFFLIIAHLFQHTDNQTKTMK